MEPFEFKTGAPCEVYRGSWVDKEAEMKRRSSGMTTSLDLEEGDAIESIISLGKRAIVLSRKSTYSLRSADALDPEIKHANVPWERCFVLPYGTNSDIVARTVIHIYETAKRAGFPQELVEQLQSISFDILMCFASMKAVKERLDDQTSEILASIKHRAQEVDTIEALGPIPNIPLLAVEIRSFIFEAKRSLNNMTKLFDVFLGMRVPDGHFHKLRNRAERKFGKDHQVTELLQRSTNWIEQVVDFRNLIEHPKAQKNIEIINFSLSPTRSIFAPQMKVNDEKYRHMEPIDVSAFTTAYVESTLTIFEEFTACLLAHSEYLSFDCAVYRLAADAVDPQCPFQYSIHFQVPYSMKEMRK